MVGAHKGSYAYEMETPFLYYVDAKVSESPAIYFVVDIALRKIFWIYLSRENLEMLNFRGRSKVTCWFTEENVLDDVGEFTRKLEKITENRNAMLEALNEESAQEGVWQRYARNSVPRDPGLTFDSYLVSPENRMTVQALQAVARNPGNAAYNPVYLYGPRGVGKTHLLNAVANQMQGSFPQAKIMYLTAERFVNEMIEAIRDGKIDVFHRVFNGCDVLIIEDVQFVAGKESTQEEIYHRVEALCRKGKQVVISSSLPLKELPTLDDRLSSAFGMGICLGIALPDRDTRLAIVRLNCQNMELTMEDEVAEYIAECPIRDTRHLIGVIKKLAVMNKLLGMPVTKESAAQEVKAIIPERTRGMEPILKAVCEYYGVDRESLRKNQKNKTVALARQMAVYLLTEKFRLAEIADELQMMVGNVHRSLQKTQNQLQQNDERICEDVRRIREKCGGPS